LQADHVLAKRYRRTADRVSPGADPGALAFHACYNGRVPASCYKQRHDYKRGDETSVQALLKVAGPHKQAFAVATDLFHYHKKRQGKPNRQIRYYPHNQNDDLGFFLSESWLERSTDDSKPLHRNYGERKY